MRNQKGFTLIEMITTISLGLLITILITSAVNSELSFLKGIKNDEMLHSNAIFIFDNLNYLIKRAKIATTTTPTILNITLLDHSKKEIKKDDNNITINDVPFNSSNIKVTGLNFIDMGRSIRVGLTLETASSTFSATTTIARRLIMLSED